MCRSSRAAPTLPRCCGSRRGRLALFDRDQPVARRRSDDVPSCKSAGRSGMPPSGAESHLRALLRRTSKRSRGSGSARHAFLFFQPPSRGRRGCGLDEKSTRGCRNFCMDHFSELGLETRDLRRKPPSAPVWPHASGARYRRAAAASMRARPPLLRQNRRPTWSVKRAKSHGRTRSDGGAAERNVSIFRPGAHGYHSQNARFHHHTSTSSRTKLTQPTKVGSDAVLYPPRLPCELERRARPFDPSAAPPPAPALGRRP